MQTKLFGLFKEDLDSALTPSGREWLDVTLTPCENGQRVLDYSHTWKSLTTHAFHKLISNVSFNSDKPLSWSSQLSILFKVVELGDVDKLKELRNLTSYDQIPLHLRDKATGKTILDVAGSMEMVFEIRVILLKQDQELLSKRYSNSNHKPSEIDDSFYQDTFKTKYF